MFPKQLYDNALTMEFMLAYNKLGAVESWQNIPVSERNWHYNKLLEVKKEEKRQQDEAAAKMRSPRKR